MPCLEMNNQQKIKTYTLESIVEVAGVNPLALQKSTLVPPDLLVALLVNKQDRTELLGLDVEKTSQLLEVHGGVKTEVRLDGGVEHVGLNLLHEDGKVVLNGVDVALGGIKVGRYGRDELGARSAEELLEDGEGLRATTLELQELLAVLLTEGGVDGVIQTSGLEGNANGDESEHLVALLVDVIVLRVLLEVLGPGDVDQDVAEHAESVGVAAHHHVRETHIVVCGEVGSHDTGEHGLLVELNVVESLKREAEVTEKAVDPEEANDREVAQHLVKGLGSVGTGDKGGILTALGSLELFLDLRLLDQGVENVEHAVATPGVWVLLEKLSLLLVVSLPRDPRPVCGECVELVNEFINHIPGPVVLPSVSTSACWPSTCNPQPISAEV